MVAEQLVQMLINVILGVLTARYLGKTNYGVINETAAYVIFFSNLVTLGLEAVSIKEMVNNRDEDSTVVGTGIGLRLMAGTLSTCIVFALLFILKDGNPLVLKVGFLQSLVMIFKAFELIDYWFQSKLQSKYVAILKSISYVLVAAYKFFIIFAGKSVVWFAFSTSLDFLLIAVMIVIAYFAKGCLSECERNLTIEGACRKTFFISKSTHRYRSHHRHCSKGKFISRRKTQ